MATQSKSRAEVAAQRYIGLKQRDVHPDGWFDKAGRWYPSKAEERPCCSYLRQPTRSYPYSLMTHCRSREHVFADLDAAESKLANAYVAKHDPAAIRARRNRVLNIENRQTRLVMRARRVAILAPDPSLLDLLIAAIYATKSPARLRLLEDATNTELVELLANRLAQAGDHRLRIFLRLAADHPPICYAAC